MAPGVDSLSFPVAASSAVTAWRESGSCLMQQPVGRFSWLTILA